MTFQNPHIILMAAALPILALAALIWAIAQYRAVSRDWERLKQSQSNGESNGG